jgi:hypothetical protein
MCINRGEDAQARGFQVDERSRLTAELERAGREPDSK